jgi:ABC-type antimicrobial peptide transport system permease subunit
MLIFGALTFSFLVGTISGLIPAIKAAKQNPIDALNYAK